MSYQVHDINVLQNLYRSQRQRNNLILVYSESRMPLTFQNYILSGWCPHKHLADGKYMEKELIIDSEKQKMNIITNLFEEIRFEQWNHTWHQPL